MEGDRIGTTLFITTVQLAELLRPGLGGGVPRGDIFASEGVLHCWVPVFLASCVFLEKLASAMAEELVESHDEGQGLLRVAYEEVFVGLGQELEVCSGSTGVHVAEVDVLEAFSLANVVVVGNVDSNGSSRAAECHNVEVREVRLGKDGLLEVLSPWEFADELFGVLYELSELS